MFPKKTQYRQSLSQAKLPFFSSQRLYSPASSSKLKLSLAHMLCVDEIAIRASILNSVSLLHNIQVTSLWPPLLNIYFLFCFLCDKNKNKTQCCSKTSSDLLLRVSPCPPQWTQKSQFCSRASSGRWLVPLWPLVRFLMTILPQAHRASLGISMQKLPLQSAPCYLTNFHKRENICILSYYVERISYKQ